jgi:serine/threonine protein kinase
VFVCTCRDVADRKGSTWRIFSLKELHAATNNFNYDNKLGEGGFGSVYWGQLWDGSQVGDLIFLLYFLCRNLSFSKVLGTFESSVFKAILLLALSDSVLSITALQIAVKRLKVWSTKAEMEFAVEVEILGRVRHENLLSLRGYCAEGQERLIVYDYMPNLSLLSHLHGQYASDSLLDWGRRMSIAIGSAEGLA